MQVLDPEVVVQRSVEVGLDEPSTQQLSAVVRRIAGDLALRRAAETFYHALFETDEDVSERVRHIDTILGDDSSVFHALLILESLRIVRERQAARGVPPSVTQAVNDRFGGAWLRTAAQEGDIGRAYWDTYWLRVVASGDLLRVGRLEFVPVRWTLPFHVYAHRHSGTVVVLAGAGLWFSKHGTLVGTPAWESTFHEADDAVIGMPIMPDGTARQRSVRLPRAEWEQTIKHDDAVLDMHVPAEGVMSIAALHDALKEAEPFFGRLYPEHRFIAYICDSWLFSPQLEGMLGPESNIVRWQHEGYMLPSESDASDLLAFTFGSRTIDLATAPRDTRLRRAIIAHLEQGKLLCCGRFLLLRRDLGRFGMQPYRAASTEAIERLMLTA